MQRVFSIGGIMRNLLGMVFILAIVFVFIPAVVWAQGMELPLRQLRMAGGRWRQSHV